MPLVIPNFEYDIFMSYRDNNNRSGCLLPKLCIA